MDSWTYDPENVDTYPSVCVDRDEVEARFGLVGGETILEFRDGKTVAYRGTHRLWEFPEEA